MPKPQPSGFSVVHNAWSSLAAESLSEGVSLRRLVGGSSETWWIELSPSTGVRTDGVTHECTVAVLRGRVWCAVLGNEIDLPTGHFALLPPNLPVAVRTAGRSAASVVFHVAGVFPARPPLDGQ
ncbi:MAG: hypothetical protein ACM3O7_09725 [Acidobacteriota bacterium]